MLAVLLYHAGVAWAPGGWLGVDVFFVLSGFLITSLLLTERESHGRIALAAFWARRARRLLPALLLVLTAVVIWFAFWPPTGVLPDLRGDARWTLGYVANWRFIFNGESYFEQFAMPSPLRHTWSLAIEEQFYLLWPPVLIGLLFLTRGSRKLALGFTVAAAAASAWLFTIWYEPADPSRVYYGTDTRVFAILVGASLALLIYGRPPVARPRGHLVLQIVALVAAGAIAWSVINLDEHDALLFRGGLPLLAVLVAVVIAAAVQPTRGPLARCLSLAPICYVGLISYGLYLWHWPVYVALTEESTGVPGTNLLLLRLAVTFLLAALSYHLLELPVRTGDWSAWRVRGAVPAGAACISVVLLLGPGATSLTSAPASVQQPPSDPTETVIRVLVAGDTEADTIGQALTGSPGIIVRTAAARGCGLAAEAAAVTAGGSPECVGSRGLQWQDEMARFRPDVVLVADAWQGFAPEDSRFAWLGDIGALGVAQQALELAIEPLVATGRPVAMVSAWSTVPTLGDRSFLGMDNVDRLNSVIVNAAAQRHDQVQVLEPPEVDRASPTSLAAWLGPRLRVIDAGGRGDAVHAMFVGDSVSMTMTPGFLRTSDPAALTVVDRSAVGCGLLRGVQLVEGTWQETSAECGSWPERWAEDVAAYRPDVAVMQFGAWEVFDWQVDDEAHTWGSAETNAFAMAELEQAVQVLSSTGARVVLLTSPHFEARNVVSQTGEWRNRYDPARVDVWNDLLGQVAARHPDLVTVVDLYRFQSTYPDGEQLRVDGVHYTPEGADVVTEWLAPRLIAAANTR